MNRTGYLLGRYSLHRLKRGLIHGSYLESVPEMAIEKIEFGGFLKYRGCPQIMSFDNCGIDVHDCGIFWPSRHFKKPAFDIKTILNRPKVALCLSNLSTP